MDLTYGVDYEWIYYFAQSEIGNVLGFNAENAPLFWEEFEQNQENEEWWMQFMTEDNFRLYALRLTEDHKLYNRYDALIPFENSSVQTEGEGLIGWRVKPSQPWSWNFDGEHISVNLTPTSTIYFAFMKVKH